MILKQTNGIVQLINKDEYLLLEESNPSVSQIFSLCMLTAQAKFLRTLDVEDQEYKGVIRLLKKGESKEQFKVGDEFEIEIKNEGKQGFYFGLLDIQPDNIVNLLPLSEEHRSIEEYYLKPGEVFISQVMEVVEPLGTEVLKLIVTPTPVDLSNVMIDQAKSLRGKNQKPLEVLLVGKGKIFHRIWRMVFLLLLRLAK